MAGFMPDDANMASHTQYMRRKWHSRRRLCERLTTAIRGAFSLLQLNRTLDAVKSLLLLQQSL